MNWLKKDVKTPNKKEIFSLVLIIMLPNLFFLSIAFYTSTSRPLINIDYLFAIFILLIPFKLIRIAGGLLILFLMIFDVLMFLVQIFPFMNIAAIRYLISFIFIAPNEYIILISTGVFFILALVFYLYYLSKKVKQPVPSFIIVILIIVSYTFMILGISYYRFYGILGRDNYYIAHSQSSLYFKMINSDFANLMNVEPELVPLENIKKRIMDVLKVKRSSKILYIIAESWGEFRNKEAQDLIVKNIFKVENSLEFIYSGSFYTSGATVAGELRELCGLDLVNNGFALKKLENDEFKDCIPNKLIQENYKTFALHGTSGLLYDRVDWYTKAGFQSLIFGEDLMGLHRCEAFKGVCDKELVNIVGDRFKEFSKQKIFFYWMTLTSHQPYSKKDIYNTRFDCKKFNMKSNGDACHNAQLQTQFFDDLSVLIQQPELKGTEVIVVGDHQPPMWGSEIEHIKPLTVSDVC